MTKQKEITIKDGDMLDILAQVTSKLAAELQKPELLFLGAVFSMEVMERMFGDKKE